MKAAIGKYGASLALVAAAIGLWELVVRAFAVPHYILPAPSAVAGDFSTDGSLLARASWVTLREIVLGFAIALAAGLALAVLLHFSGLLRRALYPVLIASQATPPVVIAPILVILLGFGIGPKLVIVALVCFFPIVVNAVDGLSSVDAELVKMMQTLDASRLAIFRRVEFPSALPLVFSGTRVAATFAAIGAVFGEWSGSTAGLGYVMLQATPSLETERVLAAVVILTAISVALFAAVSLAEHLLAPWARERTIPS